MPQRVGVTGARARSARLGYSLYFANIPKISSKIIKLVNFLSDRAKHTG
jgi:hypothetical protein